MGDTTTLTDPKDAPDKPKDKPAAAGSPVSNETDLTNPANSALAVRSTTSPEATAVLPAVTFAQPARSGDRLFFDRVAPAGGTDKPTGQANSVPTLDQETLNVQADKLHQAINKGDLAEIRRILQPLPKTDRDALSSTYHNKFDANGSADTLDQDLKKHLKEQDYLAISAILKAPDGRTNETADIAADLARLKNGDKNADIELREVLSTLTAAGIDHVKAEYVRNYGISLDDAINQTPNVSNATRQALPLLEKGIDGRTAEDDTELARIAVKNKDLWLLGEALRGDSPAAVQARQQLQRDTAFQADLDAAFERSRVAHDLV
jgi:hypothetical protein